jgi:hypothetical protein
MNEFVNFGTFCSDINSSLLIGQIIEQLKFLSSSMQDLKESVETFQKSLNVTKPWWREFDQLISAVVGALTAVGATFLIQFLTERSKQYSKIAAAIAAFESTRITLLTFKGQFIMLYEQEMYNLLCEYRKERKKLGLSPKNKINSYLGNDQVIEKIRSFWVDLRTPFQFEKEQTFYKTAWSEELSFLVRYCPEYLITFQKDFEVLLELNKQIASRNDMISQYRKQSMYGQGVDTKQV